VLETAEHEVLFALPTDSGGLVELPLAEGQSAVFDFWAPSCAPCKKSLPALYARRDEIASRGGRLILVAVLAIEESTDQARQTLAAWGVENASFLVDRDDVARRELGVQSLPATIILDARGKVLWVAPEGASSDDIVGQLEVR
jgi:thiol-disulfide isomerase/thioredoxin